MDTTTEEYAKRAIDLIGLEYPADIQATYNDLPTDLPGLMKLQYHLHTLYSIGEQTNNSDLADYALFANLHVRYRILAFETDLLPSDAYYFRVYEQTLPLMKWSPLKECHHDEVILPFFDVITDLDIVPPLVCSEVPTYVECVDEFNDVTISSVCIEDTTSNVSIEAPVDTAPSHLGSQSFTRAYLEYRTRIGSDLIIRSTNGKKIWTTRLTLRTMDEFSIFAASYYGVPTRIVCDDAKYLASLYASITGRYAGYESAGYYVSATSHARVGPASLMTLSLQKLSKVWLTSPPLPRCM